MMMLSGSKMKATVMKILESYDLIERFQSSKTFAVRIQNPPFMPLTIERQSDQVTVTHYYEMNGDLIPDPDMEFKILNNNEWVPVAIQHAIGTYQKCLFEGESGMSVKPKAFKAQLDFANLWAKNLIQQGYQRGTIVRIDER